MATITERERGILTSVGNMGRLESAHLKLLFDQINADTAQAIDPYLLRDALYQLRANGYLSPKEAGYISAAITVRAATHNGAISDAVETRLALRRFRAFWPQNTVEGIIALLCD